MDCGVETGRRPVSTEGGLSDFFGNSVPLGSGAEPGIHEIK